MSRLGGNVFTKREAAITRSVAVSVIAFAVERDWLYVLITAIVLVVLLRSVSVGETGG
ncbi:MAG: DUF1634 domain-containing protein [Chloroflexi bacterium]|nr:DUF1634 domain-containing protein [Chloroflexota bacterium]